MISAAPSEPDHPGELYQLYGRRKARPLRPRQQQLVDELLPTLRIDLPLRGELRPEELFFTPAADVWLEIGFGGGEHLASLADANRHIGFLGAEPFLNGIAKLLQHIAEHQLANMRIFDGDARLLLKRLASASLGRIYMLYPDPWPKRRHARRRLINPATLAHLHRVMKPGAELRLATDSPAYVAWSLSHILRHPGFEWLAKTARDWREPPPGWTPTRYEAKALRQGRRPYYLAFRRRP